MVPWFGGQGGPSGGGRGIPDFAQPEQQLDRRQHERVWSMGLHEEPLAEPSGPQVKVDIHRDGTLAWMLREMVDEIIGYEQNILGSDMTNPAAVMFVVDWQARRSVLVGW